MAIRRLTRIDGSMNAHERIQAMTDFETEDDGPRFIMCSRHACGAGVSLTRGNAIWLCNAWWNASIEAQAMDRVHRIGQKQGLFGRTNGSITRNQVGTRQGFDAKAYQGGTQKDSNHDTEGSLSSRERSRPKVGRMVQG